MLRVDTFKWKKIVKVISKNLYGLKRELKNRGVVGHHFVGKGVG
jgi:hypothetical protein